MMDIADTLIANSDQLNADDLVGGPITARIEDVRRGASEEQPVVVVLSDGHRPWRPCKTVRRILAQAWGTDTTKWIGQHVQLYRDPTVKWGGKEVGGIRVQAMTGIRSPIALSLAVARGKKDVHKVEVLMPPGGLRDYLRERGIADDRLDAWLASVKAPRLADHATPDMQAKLLAHLQDSPGLVADLAKADDAEEGAT